MSQISVLLERLGALIQQSVRDAAARQGLLPIHIQVLHYLMRANRYSDLPIAIAEYFGITRGTVSQTLAVLERKGLLTKEPDAQHGKRVHLKPVSYTHLRPNSCRRSLPARSMRISVGVPCIP